MIVMLLSVAGALGAVCRLAVDGAVRSRYGSARYATLLVNVTGSFALGVVTGLVLFQGAPGAVRTVLGAGFCGGYTTFSTASVETARLVQERRLAAAAAHAVGTLLLTVLAAAGGLAAAHG
jgi:CrcB protein